MSVLIILNREPHDGTDVTWNALRHPDCAGAIVRDPHVVPEGPQEIGERRGSIRVVLHDEDVSPRTRLLRRRGGPRPASSARAGLAGRRMTNSEPCPGAALLA